MYLENRDPVALAGVYRAGNINVLAGNVDVSGIVPDPHHLQARRIRERIRVSWPVARVVAELAFASGRA